VKNELSVLDDRAGAQSTALGHSNVTFGEEATLEVTSLADKADVERFFGYLTRGELYVKATGLKLIELASIPVTESKRLKAKAGKPADSADANLTIRNGAYIITDDGDELKNFPTTLTVDAGGTLGVTNGQATLESVTSLTVDGTLDGTGTAVNFSLLQGKSATGAGTVIMGSADFGPYAGELLGIANVESAAATITTSGVGGLVVPPDNTLTLTGAAVKTTSVVTVSGTLVIKGSMTPGGSVTVKGGGAIEVTRADPIPRPGSFGVGIKGKLTIGKNMRLTIEDLGTVTLSDAGSLVLEGEQTSGTPAGLFGTGKLVANSTEIVGGESGWVAVTTSAGNGDIVTIEAGNVTDTSTDVYPYVTTIMATGPATNRPVLTAKGVGASITQRAGQEGNMLNISANTIIELGGAVPADWGRLSLAGHPNYPGEIALYNDTSMVTVKAGSGDAGVPLVGAKKIDNVEFQTPGNSPNLKSAQINIFSGGGTFARLLGDANSANKNFGLKGGNDDGKTVAFKATAVVSK
jgi:hypothetical protein